MKMILRAALLAFIAVAGSANAVGVAGQGTWETTLLGRDINGNAVTQRDTNGVLDASAVFLYDTVLNVTWLRDANYARTAAYWDADANGRMNWTSANSWAAYLTVGAYQDWRLPTKTDTGAVGCDWAYSGTDCGYNVQTTSGGTVYNEMASVWYDALGNKGYYDTSGVVRAGFVQTDWGLVNTGDFQNLEFYPYWSGVEYPSAPRDAAWSFHIEDGYQDIDGKDRGKNAMAVRPGDVLVSAVPEPETYALMLAGLAVVGAVARRRKAA